MTNCVVTTPEAGRIASGGCKERNRSRERRLRARAAVGMLAAAMKLPDPPATLVVIALEVESQGLFAARGVPVLYTGIGKINAAMALTRALAGYRQTGKPLPQVLNLGTAGSRHFPRGAFVECHHFVQRDMDVRALGFAAGHTPFDDTPARLEFPRVFAHLPAGICGSGDSFETGEPRLFCEVVDMEAYALAKVCHIEGAPFACAKYITDGANETAAVDWQDSLFHAASAFWQLYEHHVAQAASAR
jgi:adenosylhomocysteine nucleosidase